MEDIYLTLTNNTAVLPFTHFDSNYNLMNALPYYSLSGSIAVRGYTQGRCGLCIFCVYISRTRDIFVVMAIVAACCDAYNNNSRVPIPAGTAYPLRRYHTSVKCTAFCVKFAWCREHSAVTATELLQPLNLACGTLFGPAVCLSVCSYSFNKKFDISQTIQ